MCGQEELSALLEKILSGSAVKRPRDKRDGGAGDDKAGPDAEDSEGRAEGTSTVAGGGETSAAVSADAVMRHLSCPSAARKEPGGCRDWWAVSASGERTA